MVTGSNWQTREIEKNLNLLLISAFLNPNRYDIARRHLHRNFINIVKSVTID